MKRITKKDREALIRGFPYGGYVEESGSIVYFNRDYEPICRVKSSHGPALNVDRSECIKFVNQFWLYDDANCPTRNKSTKERLVRLVDGWQAGNRKSGMPLVKIHPADRRGAFPPADPHADNIAFLTGEDPNDVERRLWADDDMPGHKG